MSNLYIFFAKYSLRFSKHLHCKRLTSRGPMFLQLCSFRVSRPLVQSDGSYLRDNVSKELKSHQRAAPAVEIRETIIFDGWPRWVIRPVLLQSDTPKWRERYEWRWRRCRRKLKAETPISSVPWNKWPHAVLSNLHLFLCTRRVRQR